ncbi:MAG: hypothetical protein JST12_12940 [Armatimonadetes bacterium]|nr:hypothetical protein [Armatimonadota bacterium]MBS1702565.1 hypothetical protein [Armatimonadota bacterium]MBS1725993.1 hypothetical protein [Armatimonadota bacterium]
MKNRNTLIASLAVAALLALIGCGAGDLDQGQVKYTPGVPPWKETDPAKKGPGGISSGGNGGGTGGAQTTAPGMAPGSDMKGNSTAPPPGGGPPGMTAPDRGMGGK